MADVRPMEKVQPEQDLVPRSSFEDDLEPFPDHTQLPAEDGSFVKNFQEHPQSVLLTESIWPVLQRLHPDGQFAIGQDSGIYWRLTEPREKGAVSPDWYYVPNVPPLLDGQVRRSYVLWREFIAPLIVIEFVSDHDGRETDRTPYQGKFWIYENVVHPAFYAIYQAQPTQLDLYQLVGGHFQLMKPNRRRHYPIDDLGVEIGLWHGSYMNLELPWLRWWDAQGVLLPTGEERAHLEAQRADREAQRAEHEAQRADREAQRAEHEAQRAGHEAQRAEHEAQRAARLAEKLRALGVEPDEDEVA